MEIKKNIFVLLFMSLFYLKCVCIVVSHDKFVSCSDQNTFCQKEEVQIKLAKLSGKDKRIWSTQTLYLIIKTGTRTVQWGEEVQVP